MKHTDDIIIFCVICLGRIDTEKEAWVITKSRILHIECQKKRREEKNAKAFPPRA